MPRIFKIGSLYTIHCKALSSGSSPLRDIVRLVNVIRLTYAAMMVAFSSTLVGVADVFFIVLLLVVPLLIVGLSLPALIGNDAVGDDDVVGTMAIISMTIIQGKRRFFATVDRCFGNMLVDTSFTSLIMVPGYLFCLSLLSYQYSTCVWCQSLPFCEDFTSVDFEKYHDINPMSCSVGTIMFSTVLIDELILSYR